MTYESAKWALSAEKEGGSDLSSSSPIPFPEFIDHILVGLGNVVREAQSMLHNLLAESVMTVGATLFNLTRGEKHEDYLRLFEAMIEGMLEYEVRIAHCLLRVDHLYLRVTRRCTLESSTPLYQTRLLRACVWNGSASFVAICWRIQNGWVEALNLLPIAIINMATRIIYMIITRKFVDQDRTYNATDLRWLLATSADSDENTRLD